MFNKIWFVKFMHSLARNLPKRICYYCAMRIMLHYSSKHTSAVIPEVLFMDALKEYAQDNNI